MGSFSFVALSRIGSLSFKVLRWAPFRLWPLDWLPFVLDGLLLRWASFRLRPLDGFLFEITFANSRGWLLFKMNTANIELDDYKTMSKTTTQIFQPRKMLKCQLILKKNTNLIIYCLNSHGLL